MTIDKILITLTGTVTMGFIWWFFFGKKDEVVEASVVDGSDNGGTLEIVVDGGYKPSAIRVKKGSEVRLRIIRKDPSSCLEDIILPDFKISKYLPLNEAVEIKFTPKKTGEFGFHCGMNMYHGKIIIG